MRLAKALLELVILALLSHSLVDFSSPAAGNEGLLQYTLVAALARRGHLGIHARAYRRANNPSFALFRSRAGLRESFESAAAAPRSSSSCSGCFDDWRHAGRDGRDRQVSDSVVSLTLFVNGCRASCHTLCNTRLADTIECLPQCGCRSSVVLRVL